MTINIEGVAPPVDETPDSLFYTDPVDDPRPDFGADDSIKLCAVDGCTNETALTPTGRKGKYCEDHNTSAKRSGKSTSKATRSGRGKWNKAPEVEQALNQFTGFLAIGVSALGMTQGSTPLIEDAKVIRDGMPAVNHELVVLAANDPTFRKYLEWLAAPGKYGALVSASLAVVVPIIANHGVFDRLPGLFMGSGSANNTGKETGS